MKKESLFKVIEACVLLVIGVLFCVSMAMGLSVLSIILGSALIVAGSIIVILSLVKDKSVLSPIALGGLLALALGIFFIAANAVDYIFRLVPFVLIVFGSGLFIDAFLGYFARNEKFIAPFVIKLVVGAIIVVVGVLLLTVEGFADYVALIVGICLILIAIVNLVIEFTKASRN